MVILLSLLILLSILYLYERAKYRAVNKEICYMKEWISAASCPRENRYLLVPSDNLQVRELGAEMNRLLDTFYAQKAEYERSKQAMMQVLTNISHDLRTPLTVLKGYSELLHREIEKTSETGTLHDMALKIDCKANELVATINDYFTMSKITSGDMKIDLQRTNISEICHEVILDYYDILEEAQYNVDIEIGPSPEYAYADMDALKRILKNLLDNAIRHGRNGKYLGLRLRRESGKVGIEVEDHGPGIPEKEQAQIFYRNYTTAHKSSGSGLGLTIVKNLALQMEADIQVMSEPGVKTVFRLTLKS